MSKYSLVGVDKGNAAVGRMAGRSARPDTNPSSDNKGRPDTNPSSDNK